MADTQTEAEEVQEGEKEEGGKPGLTELLERALARDDTEAERQLADHKAHMELLGLAERALDDADAHRELGGMIAEMMDVAAEREGIARRLLEHVPVSQDQWLELYHGHGSEETSFTWLKSAGEAIFPTSHSDAAKKERRTGLATTVPSFKLQATARLLDRSIRSGRPDFRSLFLQIQQKIMLGEDLSWRAAADMATNSGPSVMHDLFHPQAVAKAVDQLYKLGHSAAHLVLSGDCLLDLQRNANDWAYLFDPATKHNDLVMGRVGKLHGMQVHSDYYRQPSLRFLRPGEFYVVGNEGLHGQWANGEGVHVGSAELGSDDAIEWPIQEILSMVVLDTGTVVRSVPK